MIGKFRSPMGMVFFTIDQNHITDMTFDDLEIEGDHSPLIDETIKQLSAYFLHQRQNFNLPIKYQRGTPFQQEVWNALLTIPYGQTRSYQDIAIQIGRPQAIRAVGQACKMNPIGIVVPCHRVIGKDGSMRGYSGPLHVDLKQKLLIHEQS